MNTRAPLDDAIDTVAARLTRVDDNAALAAQIINALPERVDLVRLAVPLMGTTSCDDRRRRRSGNCRGVVVGKR